MRPLRWNARPGPVIRRALASGYASIIWVYEDGIRDADHSWETWSRISDQLGEATLQVCLGHRAPRDVVLYRQRERELDAVNRIERIREKPGPRSKAEPVTSASVGNHANCVELCAKMDSTWNGLFLWSGNCLRPIEKLDAEDLALVETLVREEKQRRSENK